jgi:hypothetical protein
MLTEEGCEFSEERERGGERDRRRERGPDEADEDDGSCQLQRL